MVDEDFDMVVLSVGLEPSQDSQELAHRLGIELNHYNFATTTSFNPVETSRPGVFVCGVLQGPKDIPMAVMEASAAAGAAASALHPPATPWSGRRPSRGAGCEPGIPTDRGFRVQLRRQHFERCPGA